MIEAANEELQERYEDDSLAASFDDTWQKRGHVSKNCAVCSTGVDTGKVIHVEVLSTYYQKCETSSVEHEEYSVAISKVKMVQWKLKKLNG
jgi:hypothetical protein